VVTLHYITIVLQYLSAIGLTVQTADAIILY